MAVDFRAWLGVAAATTTTLLVGVGMRQSPRHVVEAGVWFEDVTYETSVLDAAHGGPLTAGERAAVQVLARAEVTRAYAPSGTPRIGLVDAIGRGLGRVAAHELAHQILPLGNFHRSTDEASYDFADANRTRQFYGDLHWDRARPWLEATLGRRAAVASTP